MDQRDHLILTLSAPLRAERQTRYAFETCIAAGVLQPDTLQALISDPIPVITQDDINYADDVTMRMNHAGGTV